MKFITWNLNANRGATALDELLRRESPDVVLVQEARSGPSWGHTTCGTHVADCSWGSWVSVRTGSIETFDVPAYSGWVAGGRVDGHNGQLHVFSIHAPSRRPGAPRRSYVAECRAIVGAIVSAVANDSLLVIGGDFNCGIGERAPDEARATSPAERAALSEWRALGFTVAWRDSHVGSPLPQTLRWTRNPETPYHCDGFLVRGAGSASVSAEVLDEPLYRAASDHNPVVCTIRRERGA